MPLSVRALLFSAALTKPSPDGVASVSTGATVLMLSSLVLAAKLLVELPPSTLTLTFTSYTPSALITPAGSAKLQALVALL